MSDFILKAKGAGKTWLFAALFLVSVTARAGQDYYEVYLNKTLLLKEYVGSSSSLMSLQLDKAKADDRLVIVYSHCTLIGKGRSIAIKDENNKVLKEWKFADPSGSDLSMSIPVKEIMEIKIKHPDAVLNLMYAAAAGLPKGLMLASIKLEDKSISVIFSTETARAAGISTAWLITLLSFGKYKVA